LLACFESGEDEAFRSSDRKQKGRTQARQHNPLRHAQSATERNRATNHHQSKPSIQPNQSISIKPQTQTQTHQTPNQTHTTTPNPIQTQTHKQPKHKAKPKSKH
jgi:hypothetical protein